MLIGRALLFLPHVVLADVYINNPRGGNNKLNEQNNNRANNNRLFDSQNNNEGGHQVGDNCDPNCLDGNNYQADQAGAGEGTMQYSVDSKVYLEWYAQHGCGVDHPNTYCQIVIQYMCNTDVQEFQSQKNGNIAKDNDIQAEGDLRNGKDTQKIEEDGTCDANVGGNTGPINCGMHEPPSYYAACKSRERNKGLYTADQNMQNNRGATSTRQDRQGNRNGLECPEERDYYPYWHPNPWHDIAVLTNEPEVRCDYYKTNSQNVVDRHQCEDTKVAGNNQGNLANNEGECAKQEGTWTEKKVRVDGEQTVQCTGGVQNRDNNNGNARNGQPIYFVWDVPKAILDKAKTTEEDCVLRLRYNISTGDFTGDSLAVSKNSKWGNVPGVQRRNDYFNVFKEDVTGGPGANNKMGTGIVLPGDPRADFLNLGTEYTLQLQVNSDQYGRTFEDRTHLFKVKEQTAELQGKTVYNYGVRGRRGNINQVYPSVEYDFVPSELKVAAGEYLHFQWTGSDANNRNNAGNGRQGTDRSNMVQMSNRAANVPLQKQNTTLWCQEDFNVNSEAFILNKCTPDEDMVKEFAFLNQNLASCDFNENNANNDANCKQLNQAKGYFNPGVFKMKHQGVHNFVSTRNNDFTNRSHKASISVSSVRVQGMEAIGVSFVGAFMIFLMLYIMAACIAIRNPRSWVFSRRYRPRIVDCLCPKIVEAGNEERRAYFKRQREELKKSVMEMSSPFPGKGEPEAAGQGKKGAKSKAKAEQPEGNADKTSTAPPQTPPCACCGANAYWFLLNICVFGIGFWMHYNLGMNYYRNHIGLPFAKGGGFMLDLNLSFIILPMMKNLNTALRGNGLDAIIPMDDPIDTHICLSRWVFISAVIHIAAHSVLMYEMTTAAIIQEDTLGQLDIPAGTGNGQTLLEQFMNGNRWCQATGVWLTFQFGMIFLTARECIRRATCLKAGFRVFMWFHKTWPYAYLICLFHAPQRLWIWFFFPFCMVLVDTLLGVENRTPFAALIAAQLKINDVLALTFELPEGFAYQAGQYITIHWTDLRGEWHPFTLTSAPEENVLSVNIRAPNSLDWCSALRRRLISGAPMDAKLKGASDKPEAGTVVTYAKTMEMKSGTIFSRPVAVGRELSQLPGATEIEDVADADQDASFIETDQTSFPQGSVVLQIQGPFGAPAQHVWEYETILVVGSGIGVTPFVAILRSIQLRAMQRNAMLGRNAKDSPFAAKGAGGSTDTGSSQKRSAARGKNYDVSTASIPTKTKEQLVDEIIPIPRRVRFVWIVRGQDEVTWFYDLLANAVDGPCKDLIDIQIHMTGTVEISKMSRLGCANREFFGRPNWGLCFQEMKKDHPTGHIGVFLCGSPLIGDELAKNSIIHSSPPTMTFTFYKESF